MYEGEIENGELEGFGRMINCFNKSHELIIGFWENGELVESRPWKREKFGEEENLDRTLVDMNTPEVVDDAEIEKFPQANM